MKIVVPISRSDSHRLENWVEAIKKFAGLETHSIHFIPTFTVTAKAYEAAGKLSDVCKDIRVSPLDMDSEAGWPKASNWQWWNAVQIMEPLSTPWFWMELDCLPVRQGWATEIGSDYTSGGTAFRGCIVKTPWKHDNGTMVESLEGPEDKMMCGCGIYPSNLMIRLKQIDQVGIIGDFTKGDASAEIPWDLHMRHVMRKLGMSHTDIIGDFWNTENYRMEKGNLVCDAKKTGNDGKQVTVHRAGTINPNSVVIHGCKDDSLFRLIKGGLDTRNLVKLPEPESPKSRSTENSPEVDLLKAQLKAQEERFAKLEALLTRTLSEPVVSQKKENYPQAPEIPVMSEPEIDPGYCESPSKYFEPEPMAEPAPDPVIFTGDDPTMAIIECIQNSPKQLRIKNIQDMIGVPMGTIKSLASKPGAPFSIVRGNLGWISLTPAAKKLKLTLA